MENSVTSMNKTLCSKTRSVDCHEESSWTFYFEDFLCENNGDTSSYSGHGSPSLVSDAASLVEVNKFIHNHQVAEFSLNQSCEKLTPKKRKSTYGALFDDALEDTATSPVRYLNQLDLNQKAKDDDIPEEEDGSYGQTAEGNKLGVAGLESDYTKLKKKGLCLVPPSIFANFLG